MTSLVNTHKSNKAREVALLYAIIAVMDGVGTLVSGPIFALIFGLSFKLGGLWRGLPFLLAAALFFVAGLPVFLVAVVPRYPED